MGKPSSSGTHNPGRDDSRTPIIVFVTSQVKPEKLFFSMMRRAALPITTALAFWLTAAAAHAQSSNCGLMTSCGLNRALHVLYAMATVLTIIFIIVLAAAIYLYQKNKRSNFLR